MSSPTSHPLYTLGYEGIGLDAFVARVKGMRIRTLVDVRAVALSRKKGFSKTALHLALAEAGVQYLHLPALGCPSPVRHRYKLDRDWDAYSVAFIAYLATQEAAVAQLGSIAAAAPACLMCFEADHERCHRTFVAHAVARSTGISIIHLQLDGSCPAKASPPPAPYVQIS